MRCRDVGRVMRKSSCCRVISAIEKELIEGKKKLFSWEEEAIGS